MFEIQTEESWLWNQLEENAQMNNFDPLVSTSLGSAVTAVGLEHSMCLDDFAEYGLHYESTCRSHLFYPNVI